MSSNTRNTNPSFEDKRKEYQNGLVSRFLAEVDESDFKTVAIGLDMAADEDKWGLSIIALNSDCTRGQLVLLLPHRATLDNFKQVCSMKPSVEYLHGIIDGLRQRNIRVALAVDVPLGWPDSHGRFLDTWSAKSACSQNLIPERENFEYRLCDLTLREHLRTLDPRASLFAVGADKIACAAFEWARIRTSLLELISSCDVDCVTSNEDRVVLFETYPAAFIRLNYPEFISYKSGEDKANSSTSSAEDVRLRLTEKLLKDYHINIENERNRVAQACKSARSDAIDGFLSALSAWDYLRWKSSKGASHEMTTFEKLLDHAPSQEEIEKIQREGWILVRMSPFNHVSPVTLRAHPRCHN